MTTDDPQLPSEARTKLDRFGAMLEERGPELGLIAAGDRERIWDRHIADSLRAVSAVERRDRTGYDLGSGGGLPGVVAAIVRPELEVRLVEAKRRRVAWLEMLLQELELPNA